MNFRDFWLSNISAEKPRYRAVLFDVDGTVIYAGKPTPGAEKTLQWLRSMNTPFFFLTNDSHHSPQEKAQLINASGVTAYPEEIITCSHALSDFVKQRSLTGGKVFVMGEFGNPCFAAAAGLEVCRNIREIDECTMVIVGEGRYDWHDTFRAVLNYFIRHPEREMVVGNPDSYWPGANGSLGIGAGASARFIANLLAEMHINIKLTYLGKPYEPIFAHATGKLQEKFELDQLQRKEIIMLGDALFSDIAGGRRCGLTPALMMTGVTDAEKLARAAENELPEFIFESLG